MAPPLLPSSIPYGLRDVQLTPYTDLTASALGTTTIDLVYGRTFTFGETEDFDEFRGDDQLVTEHGHGAAVAWALEAGGYTYPAYAAFAGGTVTESGTGTTAKSLYRKSITNVRPFLKVEGQSISDSGGDLHGIVWKARATGDIGGEFGDTAFWATGISGVGLPTTFAAPYTANVGVGVLYDFVQNALSVPMPATVFSGP